MSADTLHLLEQALRDTEAVERENRRTGTPESRAFDVGRVDALRQALAIVESGAWSRA
jgi:hypothetical protein